MNRDFVIGVFADSIQSAMNVEMGGAGVVYLCSNLFSGGTTPSAGLIYHTRKNLNIELNVVIRPRSGDFFYSDMEFQSMKHDIALARDYGADAVTFGILKASGTIDLDRNAELIEIARPMHVTFNRAFDMTSRPFETLEDLISLRIKRVFTSGQEITAYEGTGLIAQLSKIAGDRIQIMPVGGINERNIKKIIERTYVKGCIVSSNRTTHGNMTYYNPNVHISDVIQVHEYDLTHVDALRLKNMLIQL